MVGREFFLKHRCEGTKYYRNPQENETKSPSFHNEGLFLSQNVWKIFDALAYSFMDSATSKRFQCALLNSLWSWGLSHTLLSPWRGRYHTRRSSFLPSWVVIFWEMYEIAVWMYELKNPQKCKNFSILSPLTIRVSSITCSKGSYGRC